MRRSSQTKLWYRFRTTSTERSPSFPSVGRKPSFLTPAVHYHITRLNGLGSTCWELMFHNQPCSHWPLEQICGSWHAGFQAVVHFSHWRTGWKFSVTANDHLRYLTSWTHCRLPKHKGSSCWKVEPCLEFNMEIPEILLTRRTVTDDTAPRYRLTGALLYLSWWFLWEWPLEAHIFQYLVSNWWNCSQKIRRILPCWRRYVTGSRLWGFKRLLLVSVCILSLSFSLSLSLSLSFSLSLSVVDQDVSTQLYLHCTNMNSNPLKP